MVQEFHVLRCFSCNTFQVHIVKKSNKWNCKMCGEKQSLKKVYGKGSGKDCRYLVQSLNEKRIIDDLNENAENNFTQNEETSTTNLELVPNQSKWNDYLTEENQLSETEYDGIDGYTFERQNKRKLGKKDGRTKKIKTKVQEYNDNKNNFNEINSDESNELPRKIETSKNGSKWNSFVTETKTKENHELQISFDEPEKVVMSNNSESKWTSFLSTKLNVPKDIEISNKKVSKWSPFIPTELEKDYDICENEANNLKVTNTFRSSDFDLNEENENDELQINSGVNKKESKWTSFVPIELDEPEKVVMSNKSESKWTSFLSTKWNVPEDIETSNKKVSKWSPFMPTELEKDFDICENKANALKVTNIFCSTDEDLDDILDI